MATAIRVETIVGRPDRIENSCNDAKRYIIVKLVECMDDMISYRFWYMDMNDTYVCNKRTSTSMMRTYLALSLVAISITSVFSFRVGSVHLNGVAGPSLSLARRQSMSASMSNLDPQKKLKSSLNQESSFSKFEVPVKVNLLKSGIAKSSYNYSRTRLLAGDGDETEKRVDELIVKASQGLRRSSWFSWWSQVILTVISSITLLFATSVLQSSGAVQRRGGGFFLAGSGIALSFLSIIWTWGGRRLGRRLVRRSLSRVTSANIIRRAVKIGVFVNVAGMLVTLLGAEQIIGTLAAKVLSMQGLVPLGQGGIGGTGAPTLQPLDILIVQANTNTLFSHFISLVCTLYLNKWIDQLDPPSEEDDE